MPLNHDTKYYKLKEYLKDQILSGKIAPGAQLPSENTLTAMFSVSRHTVRKAISILTVEGYVYTEHGRGSFCSCKRANRQHNKNIGVITTYISEYIFPQVIQGVDQVLSQNGYSIILKSTGNDPRKEAQCLEDMLRKDIAGLIIEPTKSSLVLDNKKYYDTLDRYGIPYIFIHGYYRHLENKPHILLDDTSGMYTLVEHLVQNGCKHIAGLFKADDIQGINRHKGYAQALTAFDLPYNPDLVDWFHTEDRLKKPQESIRRMLSNQPSPDAIVCYNDEIAYPVVEQLMALGRKVPEDIAVTGYDDSYLASSCPIKLTTVRHPKESLGRMAAQTILDIIVGNSADIRQILKPQAVLRQSTIKTGTQSRIK